MLDWGESRSVFEEDPNNPALLGLKGFKARAINITFVTVFGNKRYKLWKIHISQNSVGKKSVEYGLI